MTDKPTETLEEIRDRLCERAAYYVDHPGIKHSGRVNQFKAIWNERDAIAKEREKGLVEALERITHTKNRYGVPSGGAEIASKALAKHKQQGE